jgi:hypothetical protein
MIQVEVFDQKDGTWSAAWTQVGGFVAVVEDEYTRRRTRAHEGPKLGSTPQEMEALGWIALRPDEDIVEIWPILVGGQYNDEYPLRVERPRDEAANLKYSTVAPCSWPLEQDREHAERIARELIAREGNMTNWIDLGHASREEQTS